MPNQAGRPCAIVNKFLALPSTARIRNGDQREWVYFVEAPAAGLVKIGHSTNLKWRLTGLQTQCPVQLSLVGLVKAPTAAEFVFHRICEAARSHGEWFNLTEVVCRVIDAVNDHAGDELSHMQVVKLAESFGVPMHESQGLMARGLNWERALSDKESNRRQRKRLELI